MSVRYPVFFEKMIERSIANMKSVTPLKGDLYSDGTAYLESHTRCTETPDECGLLVNANRICLLRGVNAVFCNRVSILVFGKRKPGMMSPHNHGSSQGRTNEIDSS
jgi:hypothetical protein